MSDFHKAWYVTCPTHKDIEHPLWRKCPKCSAAVLQRNPKTYSEQELFIILHKYKQFLWERENFSTTQLVIWFNEIKKK